MSGTTDNGRHLTSYTPTQKLRPSTQRYMASQQGRLNKFGVLSYEKQEMRTWANVSRAERYLRHILRFNTYRELTPAVAEDAAEAVRMINDQPFFASLNTVLSGRLPPSRLSAPLIDEILRGLFAAHSNGLKAMAFFHHCVRNSPAAVTPYAFDKTLHILVRMHYLDAAWALMEGVGRADPSLLTLNTMSLVLMEVAKSGSVSDAIEAFARMERGAFSGRVFGTEEFNVLLMAVCARRRMGEARDVFKIFHSRFPADTKTMNILLLGFRRSGDVLSVELFYHEMLLRGFAPNAVTYNIRIDALCKRRQFDRALALFGEMAQAQGCAPTVETFTTLVHGGGIARDFGRARQVFDELSRSGLRPDAAAYNALISSAGSAGPALMEEMEERGVEADEMTYHTVLSGLIKKGKKRAVSVVLGRMVRRDIVPGVRTVVMVMRYLCRNREVMRGLGFWRYLILKGQCPHSNALHLLVTSLCSRGRSDEAVACTRQMLARGRCVIEATSRLLETVLVGAGARDQWEELVEEIQKLQAVLPANPERKP